MSAVSVRLEGLPGCSRPRVDHGRAHLGKTYTAWRKAAHATIAAARLQLIAGAVEVHIAVVVASPMVPALRRGRGRVGFVRRPGLDNAVKGCLDALQGAGVLADDAQVVALTVHRVRGAVAPHQAPYARDARERSCCEVWVRAIGGAL